MGLINTLKQYLTLLLSLFHSGRLKERTISSHQTAVSYCGLRLFHASQKFHFNSLFSKTNMHPSIYFFAAQEESSSDITSLFPHLDMEPLTGGERYGKNAATHVSGLTARCAVTKLMLARNG